VPADAGPAAGPRGDAGSADAGAIGVEPASADGAVAAEVAEVPTARLATRLTAAQVAALLQDHVRGALPELTIDPGAVTPSCGDDGSCRWRFLVGDQGPLLILDDQSRAVRIEVQSEPWTLEQLGRYGALQREVWAAVARRPELASLRERFRYLATAAEYSSLKGMLSWVSEFPPDLCRAKPSADSSLDDSCLWLVYVGENMTDHASRLWTYLVRTSPTRVVGVRGFARQYTEVEWAGAQRARGALLRTLQSWPETQQLCRGQPGECPDITEEPACEMECAWSVRFVVAGSAAELEARTDPSGRLLGHRDGDVAGLRRALAALAGQSRPLRSSIERAR
jgi:hypothetical protein